MDIKELELKIKHFAQAYYEGHEEISDAEFDCLVDKLRALDPHSEVLKQVGWGYCVDEKQKIDHIGTSVGSLSKVKYPERVDVTGKVVSSKLDGGSIVLYYQDGKLINALTRGDGSKGQSCLNKMKHLLKNVRIPDKGMISIRGEALIPNKNHKVLLERGIPNPRNYANGILNRIDAGEDIKLIDFVPYSIRISDTPLNKLEMFELLKLWGFTVVPFVVGEKDTDLEQLYEEWNGLYPIDGVVVSDLEVYSKQEGEVLFHSETAYAYKFDNEKAEGVTGDIEWQVGDTGRVVPVLKLATPVFLTGANISSITAHNASQVVERKAGIGSTILFERANEVIPHLVNVVDAKEPSLPESCPVCGTTLGWKGLDLICENPMCKAKQDAKIYALLEACGIPDGFGDVFFEQYVQGSSIYQFVAEVNNKTIRVVNNSSHYSKLASKLTSNIYNKFSEGFSYEEFWKLARITGLGPATAKKLSTTDPCGFSEAYVGEVEGLGENVKLPSNVISEMISSFKYWYKLAKMLPFKAPVAAKQYKMQVVVTGAVSIPRKDFEQYLEENDIELKGAVSKDTKYLICNEQDSSSSKFKKAKSLGVQIVTEKRFYGLVGMEDDL